MYQRDPEVVFWPSVFLEAWGAKAKIHKFLGKGCFVCPAAFGGKAPKPYFS
jgi:hypothetical protein